VKAKYRKLPVVVEAAQWLKHGDDPDVSPHPYEPDGVHPGGCEECACHLADHGRIKTLEGHHIVCPGDYIITGIKGERYPCKPDIFEATYERVEAA
jgi:hypothetical protein